MKKILLTIGFLLCFCSIASARYIDMGDLDVQGDLTLANGGWRLLTETTVVDAITELTFSGLNGDSDEVYRLETKIINGYAGAQDVELTCNGDKASNYGRQYLQGADDVLSAARQTDRDYFATLGSFGATGDVSSSNTVIYAKSGNERVCLNSLIGGISGTTVTTIREHGHSWSNTTDNIISITITAEESNGIGVGSNIQLWRRVKDV